ncbi:MAG: ECF-type sigma factor [Pirellulaceae bacterium]
MSDVTSILSQIESGDPSAAEQLLPLVYEELRKLATAKLAQEKSGQTLQATALVHDAYLRLVDVEKVQHWNSRGHFFAAAAEAMRRIIVEQARRKCSLKQGGKWQRQSIPLDGVCHPDVPEEVLALNEALDKLAGVYPTIARLVELRYFAGLSAEEAASALCVSTRTVQRYWVYAKAWLLEELRGSALC